ncbi:protein mono-ADP-ribosyltransferase PARP14-like [Salvelinus alpinus]|uniref:protein mono-ADP-ribosyltransferase PARP14-like n=1 Tax=Salvelinus alpinus TaxID=8036 RepID=UPI0039FD29E2
MDVYKYPVFFECQTLDTSQKNKIKKYFEIQRKSGGGDCGPVESVGDKVYRVAFIDRTVQERVLQKPNHVLEMPGGPLSLTLRDSLETSSPVSSQVSHQSLPFHPSLPVQTSPPGGLEHELHLDSYLLRYLKESPGAGRDLQQQLSSLGCSVHLHPEDGRAVVKDSGQAGLCGDGIGFGVGPWKVQVERLFKQLHERYKCHYEVDPGKLQTLLQSSTLGSEDVRVYCELGEGFVVVVGQGAEVKAKLKELETFQDQGLSFGKQEKISITCRPGQAKLRLLGEVIEKHLGKVVPGVRVTHIDSAQLKLEGFANEVRKARQLVTDKISLVLERVVPEVSSHLLSFLRDEYGRPGNLSSLLGLGGHVEVELGDTELCLFALSTWKLDQAEKDLLAEFGEEKIDLPNCAALPADLRSKLEKKLKEMNQGRRRVAARCGPGCSVLFLGHVKQVKELREEIGVFLIDQSSVRVVRHPQRHQDAVVNEAGTGSRLDETVSATSYRLQLGLQVVVCQGDITQEQADVLVNAANEDLDHARGVAAALSRAGGPEVQQASRDLVRQIGRVPTGTVVETTGGNLPCKMLLHAVGPVGGSVGGNERPLLEKTVKAALDLAETLELQTLAMPCISSGLFGVPLKVCSEAIVSAVRDFGRKQHILTKVTLIDVSGEAVRAMQEACDRLLQGKREFPGWEVESSPTTTTTHAPQRDTTAASTRGTAAPEVCVQVEIIQGTIEKQQVDALVSPMVGSDPLSSRVGNVLLEAAGPALMTAFVRESGGQTAPGHNVLVEGLSGLRSGFVFFLSCAHWDNNPQGPAVQALRQGVRKILTSCENRGFCSIAFPVVGTGEVLQFPDNVVTQVLLEEIRRYEQNRASRTPFLVRIVVHPNDRDSTKAFQTAQNALPRMGNRPAHDIRIVLLGKTGGGKSSAGNTIFRQDDVFLSDSSSTSSTQICEAHTENIKGRNITLIDTPGCFDTDIPEEELKPKIVKCITECAPGPHAFLIVLKVERYTVHENEAVAKIETYFSPEAFKYATVLFTHGDQLNGLTIEKFVQQNDELNKLVEKCGGRCHVIDNKYWNTNQQGRYSNQYQVTELLNTIEKMVRDNRGGFYTSEMLQEAERLIQAEIESLRELNSQMSEEEMGKHVKEIVWKKLLIKLSGITTGVVVGAFLGVALVTGIPLTFDTKPLIHLVKRQMAASMKTVPTVMANAEGPVIAGETVALIRMGSGIGIGAGVGIAAGVVAGSAATAGALRGGIVGATAAEEAETVLEAAEKAANAVYHEAKGLYDQAGHLWKGYSNFK